MRFNSFRATCEFHSPNHLTMPRGRARWGGGRAVGGHRGRGRGLGARAKAKARARIVLRSNNRAKARRRALQDLAALSREVGGPPVKLKPVVPRNVEQVLRWLDGVCQTPALATRLRAAAEAWCRNGGRLSVELSEPPSADPVAVDLPKHKLLRGDFRVRSDAFILTSNARRWTRETWPRFLSFICEVVRLLRMRAWSACQELSLGAARDAPA